MARHEIVLWGCGLRAEQARDMLAGWKISAVIDSDTAKQGGAWHGVPVISPDEYLGGNKQKENAGARTRLSRKTFFM